MWKKIIPVIILLAFIITWQICHREHDLTQQERNLLEQLQSGNSAEVARLIEADTNINIRDNHGNTPLHIASLWGDCESIKLLLKKGVKANSKNDNGETPLHDAADNGHIEAAELLIEKGANVNAKNNQGKTPIFPAAKSGNLDLVKLLVSNGAKIQTIGYTPLHSATEGFFRTEQFKIQCREIIEYFLSQGVDINAKGNSGYSGADATVLHSAARSSDKETIELLIEKGAQVDARAKTGKTPLYIAAMAGNKGAAEVLLNHGANVNVRDDSNNTPLHLAVMVNNMFSIVSIENRVELIQLLLDYGADVNARNNSQYTPFHNAVAWGWFKQRPSNPPKYKTARKAIIQMLLEKGADPNIRDRSGRTPLKFAEGEPEIIELLIKYRAKNEN